MNREKKQNGFTLVELLVAITILGIIMVIALPQLSNIQNQNRTTKYKKYEDTFLTSAKLYTDSYAEDMFGNNTSGCVKVQYNEMKEKSLLKDIKVNGSTCQSDDSFIIVRKAHNHYFYETSIVCKDKNNKIVYENKLPRDSCNGNEPDESAPHIIITPTSKNWTKGTNEKITIKIWDEYGMLENAEVKLTWKKDGVKFKEEKTHNFKNKRYDGQNEENALTYEVKLPQDETGRFTLIVTPIDVRDSLGNYQTQAVYSGEYQLDNTAPSVPTDVYMYEWQTNSVNPNGSGVAGLNEYSSNTWTNKYVYTYPAASTDNHVGGVYYQYKTTGTEGVANEVQGIYKNIDVVGKSTIAWRACDQLGNCSDYTPDKIIKIDLTPPTIDAISNSSNGNWTNADVTLEVTASDNGGAGVSTVYYYYDTDSAYKNDWNISNNPSKVKGSWDYDINNMIYLVAVDGAGNISSPQNTTIKIDKTKPIVESITNPSNGNAALVGLEVTLKGSDQGAITSGISKWQYKEGETGSWTNLANSDNETYIDKYNRVREQTTFYYRICDNANNCSSESSTDIFIVDKCDGRYVTYKDGTSCSEECGDGTYNRLAYSGFEAETRCEAHDVDSGGSSCKLKECLIEKNIEQYVGCDSYYITTCSDGICNYTEKNGRPATGTISESDAVATLSSSCSQSFCSAHLTRTDGTYTYYRIDNCTVTKFSVDKGHNCSKGKKTGSNTFTVNVSSAPDTGDQCPMRVWTNEPYSIYKGEIKYTASWNTYYCGKDKFCPDEGCSRWCVSK